MRTKKQIIKSYLELLNKENTLGYSEEDINNKIQDEDTFTHLEKQLVEELYATEEYKNQTISTERAFMLWCKIVHYEDVTTSRKIYNSFVKSLFRCVEYNQYTCILAPRGHGKCLDEDSLVRLGNGQSKKIKEIVSGDIVLTLDEKTGKLTKNKVKHKEYTGLKEGFKVKTDSGKEVIVSKDHPFLTLGVGQFEWVKVDKLKIGSYIGVSMGYDGFNDLESDNLELMRFFAYLIAEGNYTHSNVSFTNADKVLLDDFKYISEKLGFKTRIYINNNCETIYIKRSRDFLKSYDINKESSYYKKIIPRIYNASLNEKSEFLKILFECDGNIGSRNCLEYTSMSKELILGVQSLLLDFNIFSRMRKKTMTFNNKIFHPYALTINSIGVILFNEKIGLVSKQDNLNNITNNLKSKIRNPNKDIIPGEPIREYIGKQYLGSDCKNITRERCNQLYNNLLNQSSIIRHKDNSMMRKRREYLRNINLNFLNKLSNSDIYWDKIVEIEHVGERKMYDLEIEGTHNFIANDIFVHNSFFWALYTSFKMFLIDYYEVCYSTNTPKQRRKFFRSFKRLIDTNELALEKKDVAGIRRFSVSWGFEEVGYNEGLLEGTTIGTTPRGGHFNLVIIDDLLREDKKYTYEYTINYIQGTLRQTTYTKKARYGVTGTRFDSDDPYFLLMNDTLDDNGRPVGNMVSNKMSASGYYSVIYDAILDEKAQTVLLPEIWDFESLMREKKAIGDLTFNRELRNRCSMFSNSLISSRLFKSCCDDEYRILYKGELGKKYIIAVDSATSDSPTADYCAMSVWEDDLKNKKFILRHLVHEKGLAITDPTGGEIDQTHTLYNLYRCFNEALVVIEKNNAGVALLQSFKGLCAQKQQSPEVIEHYTHTQSATNLGKAQDVINYIEDGIKIGVIVFPSNPDDDFTMETLDKVKTEHRNFGVKKGKTGEKYEALAGHDDILDSCVTAFKFRGDNPDTVPFAMLFD